MSSLRSLAQYLGLSITTVSRALDGYPDVSELTRERVRQAAKDLNYVPNAAARRLRRGRSDSISIILPPVQPWPHSPFFMDLLSGIAAALGRRGRELTICPSLPDNEMQLYRRMVEARSSDAAILMRPAHNDARIAFLNEQNFPFLAFGPPPPGMRCDCVHRDLKNGMGQMVRRAAELGHRSIALIGAPDHLTTATELEGGYRDTMAALGLQSAVYVSGVDEAHGYEGACKALAATPRPTVLICAGDRLASGAYRALKELGLTPGVEVSVTGTTNLVWSNFFNPPLATLGWSIEDAGAEIADAVISLIEKKCAPGTIRRTVPLQVIERASLGPAPKV